VSEGALELPLAEGQIPVAPDAHEMRGPGAFGGGWRRFFSLTWMIASTEFRLSYFGSVLGPIWALMRPLMLFGVLYIVFTQVVKFGDTIKNYPVLLLFNIMMFQFFTEATGNSVVAVVNNENLVRKMHFPRMVIPLATVLTAAMNLTVNLLAVLLFMLIYGVEPQWTWILLPFLLLCMISIAAGVAMLLSSLYVRWRDVAPIWAVISTMLFYGSPVLYTVDTVPSSVREEMLLNPLACILVQARRWVVDGSAPGVVSAAGGAGRFAIPVVLAVAIILTGFWVFNREAPRIAELL
jgi:ABC-2 type transport system permease protein